MKQATFGAIAATSILGALLAPPTSLAAGGSTPDCSPAGDYAFVCGMKNPEDLVRVPGTDWVIASGMAAGGALYLIDTQRKRWTELYPGEAPRAEPDTKTYGACPGAPAREGFVTHGLSITPVAEGRSRLYVVVHGAREAVEVFDVDASGTAPVLTWRGCVPTPEAMEANSVASSPDGSLLVTIPLHTGIPIGKALAGQPTGGVYRWSPGEAIMTMVAGSELPYANGIEVSADGKAFYVASSGLAAVLAYSNTDPARLLRQSAPLSFIPDNLHAGPDGRLLTAGLDLADATCGDVKQSEEFSLEEFASCPRPFTVVAIEPASMQVDVIATGPANPRFSNITMALPVGEELWIGTFGGDRVAYGPLRRPAD
jgi:sugar lactone lactonase YvrE